MLYVKMNLNMHYWQIIVFVRVHQHWLHYYYIHHVDSKLFFRGGKNSQKSFPTIQLHIPLIDAIRINSIISLSFFSFIFFLIIIIEKDKHQMKNGIVYMENVPVMKYIILDLVIAVFLVNMKEKVLPMLHFIHIESK